MIIAHSFIAALSKKWLILDAFLKVCFGREGTEAEMPESRRKIQPLKQRIQKMSSKITLDYFKFCHTCLWPLEYKMVLNREAEWRGVRSGGVWFFNSWISNRADGQGWQWVSYGHLSPLSDLALLTYTDASPFLKI